MHKLNEGMQVFFCSEHGKQITVQPLHFASQTHEIYFDVFEQKPSVEFDVLYAII